jgi:kynurenine formamidase
VNPGAEQWWPSRWGADDQIGMLNHVDARKRLDALALVRSGDAYDLGRVLDATVPALPGRYFRQTLVTTAHHINEGGNRGRAGLGTNAVNWITETFAGTTQVGTHLDALAHLQIGDRAYNGRSVGELAGNEGVARLGAETIPQIVTCGWLIDVARIRGVDCLDAGAVVGIDDVEAALGGRRVTPGDAVLFHTGWGAAWDDRERYLSGEPGPGLELAGWLADHEVALTGCDTWSYGPIPAEDPDRAFEVPQTLNVRHGIFVVENLETAQLAAAGVDRFALILTHPRLRGASGAWCAPLALV